MTDQCRSALGQTNTLDEYASWLPTPQHRSKVNCPARITVHARQIRFRSIVHASPTHTTRVQNEITLHYTYIVSPESQFVLKSRSLTKLIWCMMLMYVYVDLEYQVSLTSCIIRGYPREIPRESVHNAAKYCACGECNSKQCTKNTTELIISLVWE